MKGDISVIQQLNKILGVQHQRLQGHHLETPVSLPVVL